MFSGTATSSEARKELLDQQSEYLSKCEKNPQSFNMEKLDKNPREEEALPAKSASRPEFEGKTAAILTIFNKALLDLKDLQKKLTENPTGSVITAEPKEPKKEQIQQMLFGDRFDTVANLFSALSQSKLPEKYTPDETSLIKDFLNLMNVIIQELNHPSWTRNKNLIDYVIKPLAKAGFTIPDIKNAILQDKYLPENVLECDDSAKTVPFTVEELLPHVPTELLDLSSFPYSSITQPEYDDKFRKKLVLAAMENENWMPCFGSTAYCWTYGISVFRPYYNNNSVATLLAIEEKIGRKIERDNVIVLEWKTPPKSLPSTDAELEYLPSTDDEPKNHYTYKENKKELTCLLELTEHLYAAHGEAYKGMPEKWFEGILKNEHWRTEDFILMFSQEKSLFSETQIETLAAQLVEQNNKRSTSAPSLIADPKLGALLLALSKHQHGEKALDKLCDLKELRDPIGLAEQQLTQVQIVLGKGKDKSKAFDTLISKVGEAAESKKKRSMQDLVNEELAKPGISLYSTERNTRNKFEACHELFKKQENQHHEGFPEKPENAPKELVRALKERGWNHDKLALVALDPRVELILRTVANGPLSSQSYVRFVLPIRPLFNGGNAFANTLQANANKEKYISFVKGVLIPFLRGVEPKEISGSEKHNGIWNGEAQFLKEKECQAKKDFFEAEEVKDFTTNAKTSWDTFASQHKNDFSKKLGCFSLLGWLLYPIFGKKNLQRDYALQCGDYDAVVIERDKASTLTLGKMLTRHGLLKTGVLPIAPAEASRQEKKPKTQQYACLGFQLKHAFFKQEAKRLQRPASNADGKSLYRLFKDSYKGNQRYEYTADSGYLINSQQALILLFGTKSEQIIRDLESTFDKKLAVQNAILDAALEPDNWGKEAPKV